MTATRAPSGPDAVYAFIVGYIERNHYAPTIQEVADGCYYSHAAAHVQLVALEAQGRIRRRRRKVRGIVVVTTGGAR